MSENNNQQELNLIKYLFDLQQKAKQRAAAIEKEPLSIEAYAKKAVSALLKKLNIESSSED
ncbi:MAG: hypothetical protein AABY22_30060 [Nanoarchaeota archaeon]